MSAAASDEYYEHLALLLRETRDARNALDITLAPGTLLIIDNCRVMHGRRAFSAGRRRMCGAYVNRDDWLSRLRVLRRDGAARVL